MWGSFLSSAVREESSAADAEQHLPRTVSILSAPASSLPTRATTIGRLAFLVLLALQTSPAVRGDTAGQSSAKPAAATAGAASTGSTSANSTSIPAVDTAPVKTLEKVPAPTYAESAKSRIEQAVGSAVTIEMKSGKAFLRVTLVKVIDGPQKNAITSLQIQESEAARPVAINFASVESITFDHEKIYVAPTGGSITTYERKAQLDAEKAAKDREKWVLQARAHNVEPWPELTKEQHQAAIDLLKKFTGEIGQAFPGMRLVETQEFLFYTNMPEAQVAPVTKALDRMYDLMCQMYGIKPGERVWRGKCLVVAFTTKDELNRFESTFMHDTDLTGVIGICHPFRDGKVIIACYRGDDPLKFAHVLVHETSHGFIHRYRTATRLPSWINEGMAEWIGRALVPNSGILERKERAAVQMMRTRHNVGGMFAEKPGGIDAWQYGIASSLTDFLIHRNTQAYTRFIQGLKEGVPWPESLQTAFNLKPEQLLTIYGRTVGVPELEPGTRQLPNLK
jgi:hypothetical protein